MKQEDSFLNRLQPLSEMHKLMDKRIRFGGYNEKTLGFLVVRNSVPVHYKLQTLLYIYCCIIYINVYI